MAKARILLFLGIWVAILPHLGFPSFIKNILFLFTGLSIIYVSLVIYNQNKNNKQEFENFSENDDFGELKNILNEEIEKAEREAVEQVKKLEE